MDFGKRARASVLAAIRHGLSGSRSRRLARTALAGLILGFGTVTAGTGFVHASERGGLFDFFGQIFGVPRQVEQRPSPEVRRAPRRYASLPDARRLAASHQGRFTPRAIPLVDGRTRARRASAGRGSATIAAVGPLSVCVRTCDGYVFPLGARRSPDDVPLHQAACAAACPDAPTALYTLASGTVDLDQSVSLKGQPYLTAAWANVYRRKRVENCHCRVPGSVAAPLPIDRDPTVRVGDVVASRTSAAVVTRLSQGDVEVEDYRSSRSLSRRERRFVDMRVGALQRDAAERAFRRTMRAVDAGGRIRMAEAGAAVGGGSFGEPNPRTPGFAAIRVVTRSPFGD